LAVVVRARATMNRVNITAHIAPETSPGMPAARSVCHGRRPCSARSAQNTNTAAKLERQNAISKAPAL
jgi:hypothetical protein